MDSSVYCLPADLLGEGADRVVGTVRDRAGVSGVTVAACYHASRDILPHNPVYRVASLAPGAFYAVDPKKSSGLRFASPFWRESGNWAERVGGYALAQPRAEAPGALTCPGIESRQGSRLGQCIPRPSTWRGVLPPPRRSRSCSACCGPRGQAGRRASYVKRRA